MEETVTFLQPALSRARRITSTLVASENIGVFAALTATTTCTSSKNRAERSITSKCPAVTGSYEPGHTAIVMLYSLPLVVCFVLPSVHCCRVGV